MTDVYLATDADTIALCFPVMAQLRPQFTLPVFVEQVLRQQREFGYRLAYTHHKAQVAGAAGYRITECLAWGKFLYVDDLVTDAASRSAGVGKRLLDWLVVQANQAGCGQLHLDSGVQRFEAHRFYLRERMQITSHHFALNLTAITKGDRHLA